MARLPPKEGAGVRLSSAAPVLSGAVALRVTALDSSTIGLGALFILLMGVPAAYFSGAWGEDQILERARRLSARAFHLEEH